MRKILAGFCAALAIGSILPLSAIAAPAFSDDFESGVNSSRWVPVNAGNSPLVGDSAHTFGSHSAKQVNAFTDGVSDVYYMKTTTSAINTIGTIAPGTKEVAKTMFWDDNVRNDASQDGSTDIRGALMLAGDRGSTDFYQLGVNSTVTVNDYFWRTQAQGNFDTGIARTQGWHELRIEVSPYTGSGDVKFFIDNAPAGTGNRRTAGPVDMNELRLGISIRTPDAPFWFDNVSLDVVPEPNTACMTLVALTFAGAALRRRG